MIAFYFFLLSPSSPSIFLFLFFSCRPSLSLSNHQIHITKMGFLSFCFLIAVKRKLKYFMLSTFTDEASIYFNLNQEMKKKTVQDLCALVILIIYFVYYLDILKKTLRAGGNVLLPVDTVGRLLELILMLELVSIRQMLILTFSLFSLQYM